MTDEHKGLIKILGIVGILLILISPFVPNFIFEMILGSLYKYRYDELRLQQIIPSIRICGIILSMWAMVLFIKPYKK